MSMLKAFLGTLTLFFILGIYFLLVQKEGDSQPEFVPQVSSSNLKVSTKNVTGPIPSSAAQVTRKVSSEELMTDFYKSANDEKIKKYKAETVFLKKYMREASDYYNKIQEEKWSVFHNVYVTMDKSTESLLPFGPYKITDKPMDDMPRAQLVYNEDQKIFAIVTGRLVAKLKDIFDEEHITKDYGFKIDSVNADIKTVFYELDQETSISSLRNLLIQDARIDSFYFETVHNQWQKN